MQCNQQDKTTCNAPATYKDSHAAWYTERTAADKHMTRAITNTWFGISLEIELRKYRSISSYLWKSNRGNINLLFCLSLYLVFQVMTNFSLQWGSSNPRPPLMRVILGPTRCQLTQNVISIIVPQKLDSVTQ